MKINRIAISNILSFEHRPTLTEKDWIVFNQDINVLIGPNGAGKSNFLEVINQICKQCLFIPHNLNEDQPSRFMEKGSDYPLNKTITKLNMPPTTLKPNHSSPNEDMMIHLEIELSKDDISNIKFVQSKFDELVEIASIYSRQSLNEALWKNVDLKDEKILNLVLKVNGQNISLHEEITVTPARTFFDYLQWFNFLQQIIHAGILWKKKEDWNPLKNSFTILGSYRNYNDMNEIYRIGDKSRGEKLSTFLNQIQTESMKGGNTMQPVVFSYVFHNLSYLFEEILLEHGGTKVTSETAKDTLKKIPIFKSINDSLLKTLKIELDFNKNISESAYYFKFLNKNDKDKEIKIDELSSGEKGIIHFIFSVFGFDIENGMMLIDEPELHIHPQIQKNYLRILDDANKNKKIKFVIATHSPNFVNSNTMKGIHRFYKTSAGFTKTKVSHNSPDFFKSLRFLEYTNATNILFVDEVVLVEGDSDQYFYEFYFSKFKEKNKIDFDLNFIFIGGVDDYKDWNRFFTDWNITTYFIRDKDAFAGNVEDKYSENIFILKHGKDLESYIEQPISYKLKNTIDFSENRYNDWVKKLENQDKIKDLDNIFMKIHENHKSLMGS